jgi:hypothetical protein
MNRHDHFTFKRGLVRIFLRTKDVSLIGSMKEQLADVEEADLESATPEVGHQLLKSLVDPIVKFLKEFESTSDSQDESHIPEQDMGYEACASYLDAHNRRLSVY